jgi:hypothetical protein
MVAAAAAVAHVCAVCGMRVHEPARTSFVAMRVVCCGRAVAGGGAVPGRGRCPGGARGAAAERRERQGPRACAVPCRGRIQRAAAGIRVRERARTGGRRDAVLLCGYCLPARPTHRPAEAFHGGLTIDIKAGRLPVGAGLGSSAAFSVAVVAALLEAEAACGGGGQRWDVDAGAVADGVAGVGPLPRTLDSINEWAFAAEKLFHGAPSGLDNTVSSYGGALAYCRDPKRQERIVGMPPLRMLICNTRVPKNTRALVAGAVWGAPGGRWRVPSV